MGFRNMLLSCSLIVMLATSQARPRYSKTSYRKNFDLSTAGSETLLAYAAKPQPPMALTGNYNLIMPDYYDHHPAESMQLQNFAAFYDVEMSPGADLGMDESQFLARSTPVRPPKPINAEEQRIRQHLQPFDATREKKALQKLKKGNTKPKGEGYAEWDQFDYDLYSVNPGDSKKYYNDY